MNADQIRQMAGFLRVMPVPMMAVDHRARLVAANELAAALFGADLRDRPFVTVLRHAPTNQALDWVLDPEGQPTPPADPNLTPPGEGAVSLRATLSTEGRELPCDVTVAPNPPGFGRGALVSIIDNSGVEHAEQMRRDFVANVSHELRTPLTALMGFIETLRGPARDDPAARDRFLSIMEAEATRMNRLVADLLSLSRVESEERRRPAQQIDLALLLRGVVAAMTPAGAQAGVDLLLHGAAGEVQLPGDPDQLVQVFQNLVENAVKYGGSGGQVILNLHHIPHEPVLRGPGWSVTVEDQGEGIDPLHLPRLTERFYRVDTHRSREQGGTGLGLAIVKHIVSRHRGRLRIESEQGQGSRFTVILPERAPRR